MTVPSRHSLPTRLLHGLLASAVILQLLSSLWMDDHGRTPVGKFFFSSHEWIGLASFVMILQFWLWSMMRLRETPMGALVPWLSGRRLRALFSDIGAHVKAASRLRLPDHGGRLSPLASAVHGLGLLLVSYMALSGTYFYFAGRDGYLVRPLIHFHATLGNVVWAYLIAHAAMAVLAHLVTSFDIRSMWSFSERRH